MTDEQIGKLVVNEIIRGRLCWVDPSGSAVVWSATACEQIGQLIKRMWRAKAIKTDKG